MKSSMKKVVGTMVAVVGLTLSFAATSETVKDRIKPVGKVCMAGEPCAAAPTVASADAAPRTGEQVYATKCFVCHATGAANAPKLGDAAAWQPRLDARKKDGMYTSALKGFNGMPIKGMCTDCSDEEIKGAVDHMLAKVGK